MVDTPPQKNDEKYPLLNVEAGGGDGVPTRAELIASLGLGWNVSCSSKRSWYERLPEIVSACWMTLMLLGIFVLIIYGLGTLGVIRKQPIFLLKCNSSRPENEVYYHHIIQRGEHVPFSRFSEYLSNIASQYSSLHFSVLFLVDDSMNYAFREQRHSRLMNKLLPYHSTRQSGNYDVFNQRELMDFQLKYPNVNISTMPLTKFMEMTPLKYKWRTIPLGYLTFYARVFSVWKNGGVAIDLETFSNQYNTHQMPDRKITAIMSKYNKGTKPEEYANTLNNIDRDEQNDFFKMFNGILHLILNESRSFFNRSLNFDQESTSAPVIRTHRNKRDVLEMTQNNSTNFNATADTTKLKFMNTTDVTIIDAPYQNTDTAAFVAKNLSTSEKVIFLRDINLNYSQEDSKQGNKSINLLQMPIRNGSEGPQVLMLYDFSIFSDILGPPYAVPEPMKANAPQLSDTEITGNNAYNDVKTKKASYFLSLTFEGSFIAVVSKQHPFLGHVISAGCQRMPPRFAIQDAIMSQCSTLMNDEIDEAYCSNIYVF